MMADTENPDVLAALTGTEPCQGTSLAYVVDLLQAARRACATYYAAANDPSCISTVAQHHEYMLARETVARAVEDFIRSR